MSEVKVEEAVELVWGIARDLYRMRLLEAFYIVGSWAKGEQKEDVSDIDVLIFERRNRHRDIEKYLISKCTLDGIFGLPVIDIVEKWDAGESVASSYTFDSNWFFIPDSKIHGFIHPFENIDDELSKPYIEVTRRKKGILVEL